LSAKGDTQPTEDQIFATTEALRRIEQVAARRTRRARRNVERRPKTKASVAPKPDVNVNYNQRVVPYTGEEW
jgi:hypothetical protein